MSTIDTQQYEFEDKSSISTDFDPHSSPNIITKCSFNKARAHGEYLLLILIGICHSLVTGSYQFKQYFFIVNEKHNTKIT
jgi:hypothetical protein